MLDYRIDVRRPAAREVDVTLEFAVADVAAGASSDAATVELFLPSWTPGSYLVREFARHLGRVRAVDVATVREVPCRKVAKNRFRIDGAPRGGRVRLHWKVHAAELTVRTADVTDQHALWNHACLLLWPSGADGLLARLTVTVPSGWSVACALTREAASGAADPDHVVTAGGVPVRFAPAPLDRVMDAPLLAGRLARQEFVAAGVAHTVVLEGLGPVETPARLAADLQAIVESAAALFGGPLPYARYLFLCVFTVDGHGGLEHGDSTTLLAPRTALASDKGYFDFVSLAAHEPFHAWNVKRMRPAELWRYDYERENYTEFLWLIEGWTAYYDDLLCLRAGVFSRRQYLDAAARNVNAMLAAPGRFELSLRESSFDAWIRLYRPDANTRNSSQNYYVNGAVAAMCLDLWLRRESRGARSLDDVVRSLWTQTYARGRGYTLADVEQALVAAGGAGAVQFLESLVADRLEPDLGALLAAVGLELRTADTDRCWLGVQFENGTTIVAAVTAGAPAHVAGLHAGDEVLAIDGLRTDPARWQDVWQAVAKVGKPLTVLHARRGLIGSCQVVPQASPGTVSLVPKADADDGALALLASWLPERTAPSGTPSAAAPPTAK